MQVHPAPMLEHVGPRRPSTQRRAGRGPASVLFARERELPGVGDLLLSFHYSQLPLAFATRGVAWWDFILPASASCAMPLAGRGVCLIDVVWVLSLPSPSQEGGGEGGG